MFAAIYGRLSNGRLETSADYTHVMSVKVFQTKLEAVASLCSIATDDIRDMLESSSQVCSDTNKWFAVWPVDPVLYGRWAAIETELHRGERLIRVLSVKIFETDTQAIRYFANEKTGDRENDLFRSLDNYGVATYLGKVLSVHPL